MADSCLNHCGKCIEHPHVDDQGVRVALRRFYSRAFHDMIFGTCPNRDPNN